MKLQNLYLFQFIRLTTLACIFTFIIYGCSSSSDSGSSEVQPSNESAVDEAPSISDMGPVSGLPAQVPQPVQASLELVQDKTFRITWQTTPNAQSYRVLENSDGISGFTDISGELEAATTNFDRRVALFSRVNAQYQVQSCNDQGCVDSDPVMVTGTLDNAIGYFKASNTGEGDDFGGAISLSADGNTLAVGARKESSAATGINGNQNDDSAEISGAVYVFVRSDGLWQQQAYLKASNTGEGDNFGGAISLSADGNTLAVGAYREDSAETGINGEHNDDSLKNSGAVYVFVQNNGFWQQQAYLKASNTGVDDYFGWAASLSADGNTLAVGARKESSAATGINGNQNDDSVLNSGAVYVFVRSNGFWQQQTYLKASNTGVDDGFGRTASLSADGNTLAIGAPGENSAATGVNGDQSDDAPPISSGAVYVFVRLDGLWQQQAYIKASNTAEFDGFSTAISLSADGNALAVGAPGEDSAATGINGDQRNNLIGASGAAYVFIRSGEVWQQQAYLKSSNTDANDLFGGAISLSADGKTLAVGAYREASAATGINGNQNSDSAVWSGAVYVFVRSDGLWQQQAYLKASNTEGNDTFGWAASLSTDGKTLAVGAILEGSAATGINGDQNNNSVRVSGAVYVY